MSEPRLSEPHVLDQPWRVWATVAVLAIAFSGIMLGVVIIPVVQGRSAGLDATRRSAARSAFCLVRPRSHNRPTARRRHRFRR
jgi:hypothetical protein